MTTIIGIAGSLRKNSFNAALLRTATELTPRGCSIETVSIRKIPLYDGDLEAAEGVPKVVEEIKDRIAAADGLLLVSPEYNNSLPGAFKNAIDWLTRPPKDIRRVFGGRPVALMGATPGGMGTVLSQAAWLPVFRTLGVRPYFGKLMYVSAAHKLFDESGKLIDEDLQKRLKDYVSGFVEFVQSQS